MTHAKFKVGQVVMWMSQDGKDKYPFIVRDVRLIGSEGQWFYAFDSQKRNLLHEAMLRELTPEEKGDG